MNHAIYALDGLVVSSQFGDVWHLNDFQRIFASIVSGKDIINASLISSRHSYPITAREKGCNGVAPNVSRATTDEYKLFGHVCYGEEDLSLLNVLSSL